MIMHEAFTYIWLDHYKRMLYIGWHKGGQDDGYICSSKWMLEEYNKRPEDFIRQILMEGTVEECSSLETSILVTIDAMHTDAFYNQNNGNGEGFVNKHCTEDHKRKIGNANRGKTSWVKGKQLSKQHREKVSKSHIGVKLSKEHCRRISESHKGATPWNKGKKMSKKYGENISKHHGMRGKTPWNKGKTGVYNADTIEKMSIASRGRKRRPHSEEHKKNLSISHKKHHEKKKAETQC